MAKIIKKEINDKQSLLAELKDLFLRDGTEMAERGFFQRVFPILNQMGGSIDKNTEQLVRIKDIIIELNK